MTIEKRFIETDEIEMRAGIDNDTQRYVSGVGIMYGKEVEIMPGLKEKIRAGAFDSELKSGKEFKSFYNHNPSQVLSTTRSTPALQLINTDKGLLYKSPIPPTSYGKDLEINLERKNVRGSSFAFTVEEQGDIVTRDEKGVMHREIINAKLYEIGPVTNPAYTATTACLRSNEDLKDEIEKRLKAEDKLQKQSQIEINKRDIEIKKEYLSLIEGENQ